MKIQFEVDTQIDWVVLVVGLIEIAVVWGALWWLGVL